MLILTHTHKQTNHCPSNVIWLGKFLNDVLNITFLSVSPKKSKGCFSHSWREFTLMNPSADFITDSGKILVTR